MDITKDLALFLDSKLYFQLHVYYIFSKIVKLLSPICAKTISFPPIDSLLMLHFISVGSWTCFRCMECFIFYWRQQTWAHSVNVCYNSFFPQIHYSYVNASDHLNFLTSCNARRNLDALFFFLMFIMFSNFVHPYLKLLAFALLLKILEIFLCSLLVPHANLVPLLDVREPQIQFVKILILSHVRKLWRHPPPSSYPIPRPLRETPTVRAEFWQLMAELNTQRNSDIHPRCSWNISASVVCTGMIVNTLYWAELFSVHRDRYLSRASLVLSADC
jgi:hypothetical protein